MKTSWLAVLKFFLLALSWGFFLWALAQLRFVPAAVWAGLEVGRVLFSLAGWCGLVLMLTGLWIALMRRLELPPPPRRLLAGVFAAGWLGRYLPGKIGVVANKVVLCEKYGIQRRHALASVAAEQLLIIGTGVAVACLLRPALGELEPFRSQYVVASNLLLIAALVTLPLLLRGAVSRYLRVDLGWAFAVLLVGGYVLAHLLAGWGLVLLLQAVPDMPRIDPVQLVAMLAMAHLAGILALFAPSGIGVREAALTGLLAPVVGVELAATIAILARAWATVGDVLALIVLWLLSARQ